MTPDDILDSWWVTFLTSPQLIHVASLLHDDVIDTAETRRGSPSINAKFGDKAAILGGLYCILQLAIIIGHVYLKSVMFSGDFLLARASLLLARLRNCDVTELMAQVIADLVTGEVMQVCLFALAILCSTLQIWALSLACVIRCGHWRLPAIALKSNLTTISPSHTIRQPLSWQMAAGAQLCWPVPLIIFKAPRPNMESTLV